jgi:hypothetical protein
VADLALSWYVDFPSIRTVDLDIAELPSNDREMLEVATELMSAALEEVEGVLKESAASMDLVVIVPSPTSTGEGMGASLPQLAESVTTVPTAPVVGATEGVVGGEGPSSPRTVAAAAKEVLVSSQPDVASQVRDAPEGTTRAASPEIQEAEQGLGAALSQGAASGEAHALELSLAPWAAAFEAGDDTEDYEEAAASNTLERSWRGHTTCSMS